MKIQAETGSGIKTWRVFIALPVPAAVTEELRELQEDLEARLPKGCVRWTRREQMHLTLRFLGDVPSNQMEALELALRKVCAGVAPIQLRAEQIGFFPQASRPRVVWVAAQDTGEQLAGLQSAASRAVKPLVPLLQEEKDFRGHLTIGRIRQINRQDARVLAEFAQRSANRCFGKWTANTVEITRSELSPAGSRHTCIASMDLLAQGTQS